MQWRRNSIAFVLISGCIWCIGLVQQVHSEEKAQAGKAGSYQPVIPVPVLHKALDEHLAAVKKGVGDNKLKAAAEHGWAVAELLNVAQFHKNKPENQKAAVEARDIAVRLAKAAKAKKTDDVKAAYTQLESKLADVKKGGSEEGGVANEASFVPVAPVHDLMEIQALHFGTVKKQITADSPDFGAIETNAYILAELANVNRYNEDKDDYRTWATESRELNLKLVQAAQDKQAATAKTLFKQIHTTCGACHDKYQ